MSAEFEKSRPMRKTHIGVTPVRHFPNFGTTPNVEVYVLVVKSLLKCVIAIVVLLIALVVAVGPGGVVAGAEYPLGVGPWSSTGRYCHTIDDLARFGDRWTHAGQASLTPRQRATWLALEKSLTTNGPSVARADFSSWWGRTVPTTSLTNETKVINTWWNQNCADAMMEVPASVAHVWSGIGSHARFTHYPKNVLHLEDFSKLIR